MTALLEPLQYAFMRTGLLAAVLVGAMCATLGVYVVLRRMAFIGDALAHTTLPGLVVAYLYGWNLFGGAVDRKSTRLNSSHANISYAVFCLKKKKKHLINFLCCR